MESDRDTLRSSRFAFIPHVSAVRKNFKGTLKMKTKILLAVTCALFTMSLAQAQTTNSGTVRTGSSSGTNGAFGGQSDIIPPVPHACTGTAAPTSGNWLDTGGGCCGTGVGATAQNSYCIQCTAANFNNGKSGTLQTLLPGGGTTPYLSGSCCGKAGVFAFGALTPGINPGNTNQAACYCNQTNPLITGTWTDSNPAVQCCGGTTGPCAQACIGGLVVNSGSLPQGAACCNAPSSPTPVYLTATGPAGGCQPPNSQWNSATCSCGPPPKPTCNNGQWSDGSGACCQPAVGGPVNVQSCPDWVGAPSCSCTSCTAQPAQYCTCGGGSNPCPAGVCP
jgi:hypothetical protein